MKNNTYLNPLPDGRKQELDRMTESFSEGGCLFVEDLFLEFLIDLENGIDRSCDKLTVTFDDERGNKLTFIPSREEVRYIINAITEKLDNTVVNNHGGGAYEEKPY